MHRLRLPLLLLALWFVSPFAGTAWGEDGAVRELRIDPATTGVPFGQAKLTVDPLVRAGAKGGDDLRGGYKVEITPISFAGENGSLTIAISDDQLRKLAGGQEIAFTGQAVSTDGNNSNVHGTATPAKDAKDTGAIRVRIESRKGKLVFKTTYHLTR